jgi:chemotaxis protein methyltransferase CheR
MKIESTPALITTKTYQQLCQLIFDHSRIHLGPSREGLLTSRLQIRLHQLGLSSWEHYCQLLMNGDNADEIDAMIDLISTNHTQFFREASHFQRLAEDLLDPLLLDCPDSQRGLRCWSAAASSGEEAYSLAMVLSEFARRHGGAPEWSIEASDISRKALQRARSAIYNLDALHLPSPDWLARYFQRGTGPYEGQGKLKALIRDKVRLRRINLFQDNYPFTQLFHLIFCRNALIYFAVDSQNQLISRLHSMLEPGGLLVIGHSDSLVHLRHDFISLGGGIYRRARP